MSKSDFIEYKNKVFSNNSHIHLRECNAAPSYNCTSSINVSNIQKEDCILNYCSDFPRMNAPYLESSEQLDCLFTDSIHEIKFHIFQNISKFSIRGLIPFKYKNTCELCDNILDKYKKGRLTVKKCFVLHEEAIEVFHEKYYSPTI